jgi:hypothetical protein
MFESNHHSLKSLCIGKYPSSSFRNTVTYPLSTKINKNGSYTWVVEIIIDPISLIPEFNTSIVVMISNLPKYMLLLSKIEISLNIFSIK